MNAQITLPGAGGHLISGIGGLGFGARTFLYISDGNCYRSADGTAFRFAYRPQCRTC